MESTGQRDWLTKEEATAFIGNNASFYLEKWKSHAETTLKGWNWAAATFGIEWMAYRKMYREAFLYFILSDLISIMAAILLPFLHGDILGYGIRILIGAFGNALYRKKALRTLHNIDNRDDSQRLDALSRRGGVSIPSVIVMLLLESVYAFILFVFL